MPVSRLTAGIRSPNFEHPVRALVLASVLAKFTSLSPTRGLGIKRRLIRSFQAQIV